MSEDSIDSVKQEILFFMEKSFQILLGYIGALVALAGVGKLELLTGLASFLDISVPAIVSIIVLYINLAYLTLEFACIFAVLKRGYYILLYAPENIENKTADYRRWEIFVRIANPPLVRGKYINSLAWNVDNYYMLPLFIFIIVSSIIAAVYGWRESNGLIYRSLISGIFVFHIIPVGCFVAVRRLDAKCRQIADSVKK